MIACIHPIRIHGAEILDLKFNQALSQFLLEAEIGRECIGFKLEFTRQDIHQQLHHSIHGSKGIGEKDEADDDWTLLVEAEGRIQGAIVNEDTEQGEDVEHVELDRC